MENSNLSVIVPEKSTAAIKREARRRKMAEARSQYINGVESLGEIAERMEMHPSDVRREASNGDWKLLRDERKKEMELEIHHKSSKELKSRQIEFQRRTEVILGKMLNLADMKVDALIANEADQLGQKRLNGLSGAGGKRKCQHEKGDDHN